MNTDALYRSRFARYYRRGPGVLLFHSLRMTGLFGNSSLYDVFLSFPAVGDPPASTRLPKGAEQAAEALKAASLLVESAEQDESEILHLRSESDAKHPPTITQLCLIPFSGCNLACRYCYVPRSGNEQAMRMSEATASKSVDFFFRHSALAKYRDVLFYGGEPLLNTPAVFAAADRAIEKTSAGSDEIPLSMRLVSNGLMIDERVAAELASRNIAVVLSIDGPRDVHDRERRTVRQEGTFEQALRAFEVLRRHSIEPTASVTVTPYSVESWDRVLSFLTEELVPTAVVFNPLIPGPSAVDENDYFDNRAVTRSLTEAFERLWSRGIPEDRIGRRVTAFKAMRWRFKDCPATAGQVVVAPDGSLGPCQGLLGDATHFPLHLDADFEKSPFEHELFRTWQRRFALNMPQCLECPAISICGGGCGLSALRDAGSIWEIDRRVCDQVQPVHEWLSWRMLAAGAQSDAVSKEDGE